MDKLTDTGFKSGLMHPIKRIILLNSHSMNFLAILPNLIIQDNNNPPFTATI